MYSLKKVFVKLYMHTITNTLKSNLCGLGKVNIVVFLYMLLRLSNVCSLSDQ